MLTIKEIEIPGYEKVIEGVDPVTGLHCFIVIHSTLLGPALGGVRIHPYCSREEALQDALRLAKGMTYKSAMAENGLGGGKSVIIAEPKLEKTTKLLHAFGEVVATLKGQYIAAEDVGSSISDMTSILEITPYVAALPHEYSSGDPSGFTARGVFKGMEAVCQKLWNTTSLKGKTIAIQGLGHVGSKLANILFWEGANLIVSDLDKQLVRQHIHDYGAKVVEPKDFSCVTCDILSPCALGGTINDKIIPLLNCKAIAGSANNQLLTGFEGEQLMNRGILYAPDYIINSGGIINAAAEFETQGYNPLISRDRVNNLYAILIRIFAEAEEKKMATNVIADQIAEYNLMHKIGKRQSKIEFKR